ncbi:YciI family protein [Streptomyces sp. enrichment culture]|uniref:YciI family protein n=1 Tax=Streptomyces sp. enrichment culture TaxID=1795815 RepID=UPI003F573B90
MTALADQTHSGAQKVYFACFTEPAEGRTTADVEPHIAAHKQWLAEREQEGLMFVAGPFLTEEHLYSGAGLIVFRASSIGEAERLAAADPMHASGVRTFRIVPWQINEGSMTVRMTFSTGVHDFD